MMTYRKKISLLLFLFSFIKAAPWLSDEDLFKDFVLKRENIQYIEYALSKNERISDTERNKIIQYLTEERDNLMHIASLDPEDSKLIQQLKKDLKNINDSSITRRENTGKNIKRCTDSLLHKEGLINLLSCVILSHRAAKNW